MAAAIERTLDELVRAGSLLSQNLNFQTMASVLVEQTLDITKSDLGCLYLYKERETSSDLKLMYRRGRYQVPEILSRKSEIITFLEDSKEAVVLLEQKPSPFVELLLHPQMQSGIVLPLSTPSLTLGAVFLNSLKPFFYNRERFDFLDSFTKLAGGMLHNSKMYQDLRDTLRRIEELERYQENIFSSMTNLLITTDEQRRIHYFNRAAAEGFCLDESSVGMDINQIFGKSLGKRTLNEIDRAAKQKREVLGATGIHRGLEREMDFALNISPLLGKRGRQEGTTLLFTNQTRERELQGQMKQVVEERRMIKDMFARYLSTEIVSQLVDSPDLVKPGGDKKMATVFFADIRGYTSFSEGKEPEYIIEVLNEYFSEAVEVPSRRTPFRPYPVRWKSRNWCRPKTEIFSGARPRNSR